MSVSSNKNKRGVSLIEIVIASSIISVALVSIVAVFGNLERLALSNVRALQATELAEEGVEALKFTRDQSWTNLRNLTIGTKYYLLDWNGSVWATTTSGQPTVSGDSFYRSFILSSVNRDGSNNVVSSGGSSDVGSMKATVTVEWRERSATTSKSVETYIFDLFSN